MTKEKIIEIICELLKTDLELDFLTKLDKKELEKLTACIRNCLELEREEGLNH